MVTSQQMPIPAAIAVALALLAADAARAACGATQPVTRFRTADGTPLSEQWQAAPGASTFVLIHGFRSRGTDDVFLR